MQIEKQLNEQLFMQLPGYVAVHDLESKYALVNNKALDFLGLKSLDQIIGDRYEDMSGFISDSSEELYKQDQLVFSTEKNARFLGFHKVSDVDCKVMMGEKRVLRDNNNKVNGLLSHWTDITDFNVLDVGKLLLNSQKSHMGKSNTLQFGYMLTDEESVVTGLTNRQMECLFFMLRGKTNKSIADSLGVGERKVECHIVEIKERLGCISRSECIEKSIYKGYINIIPASLFNMRLKGMIQL